MLAQKVSGGSAFDQAGLQNEDGSEGVSYLRSSAVTLDYVQLTTIYQRRWKVEEYYKSLKVNASLAKSPTKTIRTQSNYCSYGCAVLNLVRA
jgi:hypothetical protein